MAAALFRREEVNSVYSLPHRWRLLARFTIGLLVGALALWWIGRGLDWSLVLQTLTGVHLGWVAVSVIGVVVVALAKTVRWRVLYPVTGQKPSFGTLFSGLMAAQAINLIIPIRLGELVRLGWMKQAGQSGAVTLSTILVEKAIDLLAAGLMVIALVALAVAPDWLHSQASRLALISLTLVVSLALVWRLRGWLEQWLAHAPGRAGWLPARWRERLIRMAHTLLAAWGPLSDQHALSSALGWTIVVWLLSLLTILALFAAFDLRLPIAAAVLIMLAVGSSNIVPSPPGLVGVMHLIAVVVLGQYGVAQPVAVGFGTVLNVVTVAPLLILGTCALWSHAVSAVTWLRRHSMEELWAD